MLESRTFSWTGLGSRPESLPADPDHIVRPPDSVIERLESTLVTGPLRLSSAAPALPLWSRVPYDRIDHLEALARDRHERPVVPHAARPADVVVAPEAVACPHQGCAGVYKQVLERPAASPRHRDDERADVALLVNDDFGARPQRARGLCRPDC